MTEADRNEMVESVNQATGRMAVAFARGYTTPEDGVEIAGLVAKASTGLLGEIRNIAKDEAIADALIVLAGGMGLLAQLVQLQARSAHSHPHMPIAP